MKKRLISGVKPTGKVHIGNYFGAMKQFVDLQDQYQSNIFIANFHAMTSINNKEELEKNTLDLALDYLAIGIDPEKTNLYKQSDVPAVTELAWIFDTLITMPFLMRAHAFKDSEAKNKEINVGVFNYPVLMAADILILDADIVPVGRDQKQHIEYTRDIAEKFNNLYSENFFKLPKELILETTEIVPGIDGQKMSKSYGNQIPLFTTDDELQELVMKIKTDSEGDVPKNVYAIHKLIKDQEYLDKIYSENKGKYKNLKEILLADIIAFVTPFRNKRTELEKNPEYVKSVLENSAKNVQEIANKKMEEVRKIVGL